MGNQGNLDVQRMRKSRKKRVQMITVSLLLGYNEIRTLEGLETVIPRVLPNGLQYL